MTLHRLHFALLGVLLGVCYAGCAIPRLTTASSRADKRAVRSRLPGKAESTGDCEAELVHAPEHRESSSARNRTSTSLTAAERTSAEVASLVAERLPPVTPNDRDPAVWTVERLPPVVDPTASAPEGYFATSPSLTWPERLLSDQLNFYSPHSLGVVGLSLVAGGLLANTGADGNFQHFYQENVRNAATDEWYELMHAPKLLGDGWLALPVYASASLSGRWLDGDWSGDRLATWGDRSWRSILVGAGPLVALQRLTGGSRPGETDHDSAWKFNNDNNGVSGHAFMGAVPFLAAASMTDKPFLILACYAGSTLTGLSRINDDGHYLSQALLGWSLAWVAVEAVVATDLVDRSKPAHLAIFRTPEGAAVGVEIVR